MAISSSYYINAPSLGSATAVFTDSALLICATDGFYSDGVISREQVGCVLLPQQTCPSCVTPCGVNISASGTQGIYLLDLDTGTTAGDVGAVIVRFDPYGVPDGIRATLGVNVYNKLTSSADGLHESANAGAFTYVGLVGGDCGISGTTYPALTEYLYNGTAFVATGNTQSVTVAPGDVSLSTSFPGSCLMVIPKLTSSPSIINFEVVGPCSGTAWDMSVACPVLLTGFSSSVMAASSAAVCLLSETVTYYNASLPNTPGIVGLYDFVYSDAYGSTQLPAGFYLATGSIIGGNDWFEVDANGVVIDLGTCVPPPPVSYNCVSGVCTDPGDGSGTYATLGACQAACPAYNAEITFTTQDNIPDDYEIYMTVTYGALLDSLTASGTVQGYTDAGCSITDNTGTFAALTLTSPSVPFNQVNTPLSGNPHSNWQSRKLISLTVNSTTINSNPFYLTIGANTYRIVGWDVCETL
jgi:hypothetical protein